MTQLVADISISLDGFVTGPNPPVENDVLLRLHSHAKLIGSEDLPDSPNRRGAEHDLEHDPRGPDDQRDEDDQNVPHQHAQ
jgi:hypothetical protein